MTAPPRWDCPSCSAVNNPAAAFCPVCGEEQPGRPPQAPHALAARWWRTLVALVRRPGELTAAWRAGRRKPLLPPLTLFLAVNLLFFVSQALSGVSMLSIPLSAHVKGQMYSHLAARWVDARAGTDAAARKRYGQTFDLRQNTLAKALAIAMVPPFAAVSALLLRRRREPHDRHGALHWVFGLHYYAFMMLALSALFPLVALGTRATAAAGWLLPWEPVDRALVTVQGLAFGLWASLALRRLYGLQRWQRVLLASALVTTAFVTMELHRFAVFAVTLLVN